MIWLALLHVFSTLLSPWQLGIPTTIDKDLEILLLKHQLAIYERKYDAVIRPSRPERFIGENS